MKKMLVLISSLFLYLIIFPAYSFDGITYYSTTITNNDRHNSYGQELTSLRSILRQDRANYYKYGKDTPNSEGDNFFSSQQNRSMFDTISIKIAPGLAREIIYGGTTSITVFVYPEFIEVR